MKLRSFLVLTVVACLCWAYLSVYQLHALRQIILSEQTTHVIQALSNPNPNLKTPFMEHFSLSEKVSERTLNPQLAKGIDALKKLGGTQDPQVKTLKVGEHTWIVGVSRRTDQVILINLSRIESERALNMWMENLAILAIVILGIWMLIKLLSSYMMGEFQALRDSLIALAEGKDNVSFQSRSAETKQMAMAFNHIALRSSQMQQAKNFQNDREQMKTNQLKSDNQYLNSIVRLVHEGLLVIDESLTIQEGVSDRAKILLKQKDLKGQAFIEVLSEVVTSPGHELEKLKGCLMTAFNLFLPEQFGDIMKSSPRHLPVSFGDHNGLYEFNYAPYIEGDKVKKIIVTFRSEAGEQALRNVEIFGARQTVEGLVQIHDHLADPWKKQSLLGYADEHAMSMAKAIAHVKGGYQLDETFRILHTVKGASRSLGLDFMDQLCHESESILEKSRQGDILTDEDTMLVKSYLCSMQKALEAIRDFLQQTAAADSQGEENSWSYKWNGFTQEVSCSMTQIADELGKEINIDWVSKPGKMNETDFRFMKNNILHILRNALDHGIESPTERSSKNKSIQGDISVKVEFSGGEWEVIVSDDGRGIDKESLWKKAVSKGLQVKHFNRWSNDDILDLICHPGFSSRDTVDHLSGRGVGMDAVACDARQVGGKFHLMKTSARGTTFKLQWPERGSVSEVSTLSA
ncbi:ATP-binding protein [Pseudobacteriovorax antillogorgiicola]|uniref:histidine kinase n=1 Tax=Pseudobacteriovorax antillogorgiicola TaxID=1513793 RepID=A0A1Y6C685_9BACT|nr:ATP-binding protein [Pseudobacteriovorax antillogorgiicola]TCS51248.1 Hpt domain-containing protein [Pseudobacteriovorax antillogorgiicola]SMF36526.1 Hpt domain-containing protein [Pseudobacteriovorax antillogorgiicola]